jgi:hypothetical protein
LTFAEMMFFDCEDPCVTGAEMMFLDCEYPWLTGVSWLWRSMRDWRLNVMIRTYLTGAEMLFLECDNPCLTGVKKIFLGCDYLCLTGAKLMFLDCEDPCLTGAHVLFSVCVLQRSQGSAFSRRQQTLTVSTQRHTCISFFSQGCCIQCTLFTLLGKGKVGRKFEQ